MEVEIVVSSQQVRALLDATPARIDRALSAAMTDATSYLLRQMRTYPPQRTGSSYRRTGTLGRSWFTRTEGRGADMVGHVESAGATAPYNRRVQDRTLQAFMHVGRWQTAQTVAERSTGAINEMFAARIRAAVG